MYNVTCLYHFVEEDSMVDEVAVADAVIRSQDDLTIGLLLFQTN